VVVSVSPVLSMGAGLSARNLGRDAEFFASILIIS
jgi:hypothetical protein